MAKLGVPISFVPIKQKLVSPQDTPIVEPTTKNLKNLKKKFFQEYTDSKRHNLNKFTSG